MDLAPHIDRMRSRFSEVEALLSAPDLYDNPQKAQEITREHARLKDVVAECDRWEKSIRELADAKSMLSEATDADMKAMAEEEIATLSAQMDRCTFAIKAALLPPDETDSRNTIVEIRAGTGGTEAALFGADLYRMYCRYAEQVGWRTEAIESSPGDLGGYKEIIFQINGSDVYKRMRFESGVHRVQRVPATEAQGRIHTSTATVAVLPEAKEVDIVIKPDELRIEVCRSGGPGGQGVNTTDSAVQVLHIPTGIIVRCQDGRSQIKNREKAISVLRSRLLKARKEEEEAKYAQNRRSQIGSGERHEKIRTYNYPQNRITDHRINYSTHNLPDFMEGNIQQMFDELIARDIEERLSMMM